MVDLETYRQRLSARKMAVHDVKPVFRHSSFRPTNRGKLDYFYRTAFGSAIKGLKQ